MISEVPSKPNFSVILCRRIGGVGASTALRSVCAGFGCSWSLCIVFTHCLMLSLFPRLLLVADWRHTRWKRKGHRCTNSPNIFCKKLRVTNIHLHFLEKLNFSPCLSRSLCRTCWSEWTVGFPMCVWDQRVLQLGSLTAPRWCSRSTFSFCLRSSWDTASTALCAVFCALPQTEPHIWTAAKCSQLPLLWFWKLWHVAGLACHVTEKDVGLRKGLCATVKRCRWALHQEASSRVQKAWGVKVKNGKRMKRRMTRGKILLGEFSQYCALRDH